MAAPQTSTHGRPKVRAICSCPRSAGLPRRVQGQTYAPCPHCPNVRRKASRARGGRAVTLLQNPAAKPFVFVDFYPDPDAGYHGQFRIGWGGLETSVDGGVGGSDPTGLVMSLGGGYDYWLTDALGVGGLARFTYAPLSQNDVTFHTLAFNLLASVTYY